MSTIQFYSRRKRGGVEVSGVGRGGERPSQYLVTHNTSDDGNVHILFNGSNRGRHFEAIGTRDGDQVLPVGFEGKSLCKQEWREERKRA